MSLDIKKLEKQFYADGYRLGRMAAEAGCTKQALNEAVKQLHGFIDEVIDAFTGFADMHNLLPACKKGCHWCCHQPVFAQMYELDLMNDFIQQQFDLETRQLIAARASEKRNKLADLKGDDLLHSKFPCPLLQDGVCMAYSVRPVACRIYLSSNLDSCKKFYYQPENSEAVPALLNFPLKMGRIMNEGFMAALKASGMNTDEFRIDEKIGEGSA